MAKVTYTTKQVMAGFSVSDMTVFEWRRTGIGGVKIPFHQEGTRVHFVESEIKAWAKKVDRVFDPEAAAKVAGAAKPGPKAAPVKKAKALQVVSKKVVAKKAPVKKSAPARRPKAEAAVAA